MFVVCGEALWDLFGIDGPSGLAFDARIGGSPFNVAVGLARLGETSALLTGISSDPLGTRLEAALEIESVRTQLLVRTDRPTTLSVVNLGPDGQPFYSFYGSGAADRAVAIDDLPSLGPDVWGLHAGSFSIVTEPIGSSLLALFQRERGRRLLTLDPNVRLNVEPDVDSWKRRIADFAKCVDIIKVSDEDLGLLYGGSTAQEIAEEWIAAGVAWVIVTRGENGAEAFSANDRIAVRGQKTHVVDTVGAGDTFQAAIIAGLAERGIWGRTDLEALGHGAVVELVEFASRCAAITCGRRGADLPRRSEVEFIA